MVIMMAGSGYNLDMDREWLGWTAEKHGKNLVMVWIIRPLKAAYRQGLSSGGES